MDGATAEVCWKERQQGLGVKERHWLDMLGCHPHCLGLLMLPRTFSLQKADPDHRESLVDQKVSLQKLSVN